MKNPFFERRCRYSIRKLSVGACSLMIGAVLFAGPALAEETAVPENSGANTELVSGESEHSTNEANKTEKEVQPDVPKNTEKTLKPKEIKFNSWEELLKWEPGAREDDAINR